MKRLLLLAQFAYWFTLVFPQGLQTQLLTGFGATVVDVKKITGDLQSKYNTYSYEFLLQGLIKSKLEKLKWLPELGIHRLYYYNSSVPVFRSETVWTAHIGFGIERSILDYGYLQTGANVRYFLDKSGITAGLMGGVGLKMPISREIMIPLGVRLDVVFSKSTPISLAVFTGLQIGKRER
jgi:hypothetical protein